MRARVQEIPMTDRIRRSWSSFLTWARLGPPRGHMDALRAEVGRRDKVRLAHDSGAAGKRPVIGGAELPDTE